MRGRLRTILALDEPQEVRFFLFLSAFGVIITAVYWFWSYEVAGTALLVGYSVATGAIGLRLAADPGALRVRRRARAPGRAPGDRQEPDEPERVAGHGPEGTGGGTGGIDRPFLDEAGRLPSPTLAPLAIGLGISLAATAPVFGAAPLVVGVLPLAWGAWRWLRGANDEYDAVSEDDLGG